MTEKMTEMDKVRIIELEKKKGRVAHVSTGAALKSLKRLNVYHTPVCSAAKLSVP